MPVAKAWPYPRWVAHRGGGVAAPENTLAGMRAAVANGYRMAEFDAKLSRDGIAVLMHDATLERTTSGRGPAGDLSFAELARLDEERRKLDEAQREFSEYVEELRRAKDREEFERFMAERRARPAAPNGGQAG